MNRSLLLTRPILAVLVATLWATAALADSTDISNIPDILRNYRFITSRSTVEVSGGLPVFSYDLNIAGKFGLATGYNGLETPTPPPTATPPTLSGHAEFVNVKGVLFNPRSASPLPGLDLDTTLNLTGLKGTFKVPSDIHFTGDDGQGIPMQLEAIMRGPLLHLTGATLPVPTCASCGINMYKIDAFATLGPYADFNLDGVIDNKDLRVLMSNIGLQTGAHLRTRRHRRQRHGRRKRFPRVATLLRRRHQPHSLLRFECGRHHSPRASNDHSDRNARRILRHSSKNARQELIFTTKTQRARRKPKLFFSSFVPSVSLWLISLEITRQRVSQPFGHN